MLFLLLTLLACDKATTETTPALTTDSEVPADLGDCYNPCNLICIREDATYGCTDTGMSCTSACVATYQTCHEFTDGSCGWEDLDPTDYDACIVACGNRD